MTLCTGAQSRTFSGVVALSNEEMCGVPGLCCNCYSYDYFSGRQALSAIQRCYFFLCSPIGSMFTDDLYSIECLLLTFPIFLILKSMTYDFSQNKNENEQFLPTLFMCQVWEVKYEKIVYDCLKPKS